VNANPLTSPITVLLGDNRLEVRERVDRARTSIDPTGLSTSTIDSASNAVDDVAAAIGSPGFFGADRLVICFNLVTPSAGGRRRKASKSDPEADPLNVLSRIAPGVWLVIVEDSLSATDEKRVRTHARDVQVERLSVPRGRALIDWTSQRARMHQATIDGASATRLLEALFPGSWRQAARRDDSPPDLYRLDSELAKLAVAAGEQAEITGKMIGDLVPNADELDIWGLSNAIADRDQSRAIKQLEQAIEAGQVPEMILAQLAAQFETFAVVNAARGRPVASVASRSGLSEGRLRQAGRSARNYSRVELSLALQEIRDTDFGIKQGHFEPEDALASLVAGLSRRQS
jgi:DNA polymerase III delta subunit